MNELNALTSLISILLLLIFFFWLYRDYRVDTFRQKLFKLRDELFDDARSGKISFNDPAYKMLRNAMNGFIRFGHRLNIWQILLLLTIFKNSGKKTDTHFHDELNRKTKYCNDNQKEIYSSAYLKMNLIIVEHLVLSSLILIGLVLPAVILLFVAKLHIEWLIKIFRSQFDKIDTAALKTGQI